jgi:hypothetical protein
LKSSSVSLTYVVQRLVYLPLGSCLHLIKLT